MGSVKAIRNAILLSSQKPFSKIFQRLANKSMEGLNISSNSTSGAA
ncbi:hypothetical protein JL2886_01229 [Phaeobacter gallaeciensis]|uniref:Uncharacterized protein n=1 Tax=Phaeobacter gallaeciensis TaxID=60890 RepID=A0A1B0ZPQ4_9RHOB|nr:hypothetical protein JL2886_01229 [Phaeobacter gallaeciensis]